MKPVISDGYAACRAGIQPVGRDVMASTILDGIQEVVGSIPSSSTTDIKGLEGFPSKPFFVGYTHEYTIYDGYLFGLSFFNSGWIDIPIQCHDAF